MKPESVPEFIYRIVVGVLVAAITGCIVWANTIQVDVATNSASVEAITDQLQSIDQKADAMLDNQFIIRERLTVLETHQKQRLETERRN